MNDYCPFIKDSCRDDCVFRTIDVSCDFVTQNCLIAVKLADFSAVQSDVSEICELLANKES